MNQTPRHQIPCAVCGEYKNRPVTVDIVIVNANKQILLVKRGNAPHKGKWALPGGFLDFDESVEDGVRREAAEETGITITNVHFIGVFGNPSRDPRQTVAIAYWSLSDDIPTPGDDAEEVQFFDPEILPGDIAFDHRDIIRAYHLQTT